MEFSFKGVRVNLRFWFFLTIGLFSYIDPTNSVELVLLAVLIHEVGHIAAMLCSGVRMEHLELGPFGARITTDRIRVRSYLSEIFIYLAGPLAGLLAAGIGAMLCGGSASRFAAVNVALSAFNLLPVETLDGGSFLYAVLSGFLGPVAASKWLKLISYLVLFPILAISFLHLYMGGRNISLLITCTYLALTALLR